jgi:hypothetical protein
MKYFSMEQKVGTRLCSNQDIEMPPGGSAKAHC